MAQRETIFTVKTSGFISCERDKVVTILKRSKKQQYPPLFCRNNSMHSQFILTSLSLSYRNGRKFHLTVGDTINKNYHEHFLKGTQRFGDTIALIWGLFVTYLTFGALKMIFCPFLFPLSFYLAQNKKLKLFKYELG